MLSCGGGGDGGDDDADSARLIVHVWRYGRDPDVMSWKFSMSIDSSVPCGKGSDDIGTADPPLEPFLFSSLVNDDLDPPWVAKHEASEDPALLSLSLCALTKLIF
jgi:hypothetical protein